MRSLLRIAILECDELNGELKKVYGTIGDVYKRFLRAGASQLEENGNYRELDLDVSFFDVVNKQEYPHIDDIDAVFLTGSRE